MLRPNDIKLYAISLLTDVTFMMFPFLVTRSFAEDKMTMLQAGVLGTITMLSYGVVASFSGRLSDRFGRRRMIALGALLTCSVMVVAVFAGSPRRYYILMGVMGGGVGMIYPSVIGSLSAGRPARQMSRVLLFFCIAWNIGLMIGQFTGGFVMKTWGVAGVRAGSMICALAMAGVGVLALSMKRPEGRAEDSDLPAAEQADAAGRSRALWHAWICWTGLLSATFVTSLTVFALPTLVVSMGMPADIHGTMLGTNRLICLAIYLGLNFTVFWRYKVWVGTVTHVTAIASLLLIATARTQTVLFAGVLLSAVMIGAKYYMSIFYATIAYTDADKGKAGGIHESIIATGFCTSGLIGGLLGDSCGPRFPFLAAIGLVVVTAIVQLILAAILRRKSGSISGVTP